ncbi:hypothetical protein KIW84_025320 [Lathyrus oleraceus]|uniref:Uncharacterized protein n=1 Tax=Pisum sativum TaxID=3888 RepID=A0A9D4YLJ7_PEA|nr:hypothetical protein KIW84_025320 [Pisum sativum]
MSFLSLLTFTLCSLLLAFTPSQAANFEIVNNCPYTVWAASSPGGGRRLDRGQTWNLWVNPGTAMARIWGRTVQRLGCATEHIGRIRVKPIRKSRFLRHLPRRRIQHSNGFLPS